MTNKEDPICNTEQNLQSLQTLELLHMEYKISICNKNFKKMDW